ncbi:MAG: VanZ family protein [Polyangiaceae bacterium]
MSAESEPTVAPPRRGGFFLNVVPALLYVVAVFYGGGMRGSVVPTQEIRFGDKILHAIAFGAMVLVLRRAYAWLSPTWSAGRVLWLSALTSALVGGLLELYQMALPHRSAEWLDFIADALGAALVAAALHWLTPRRDARSSRGFS